MAKRLKRLVLKADEQQLGRMLGSLGKALVQEPKKIGSLSCRRSVKPVSTKQAGWAR